MKAESGGSVERLAALPDYHTDLASKCPIACQRVEMYVPVELR